MERGGDGLRVEIRIEPERSEPYAVLHVPQLTAQVQEVVAYLEAASATEVLAAQKGGSMFVLQPQDVELVRTEGGVLMVYTRQKEKYELDSPLHKALDKLGGSFVRISKAAIVNIRRVDHVAPSFNGTMALVLKNGMEEYISRKYLGAFKARLGL